MKFALELQKAMFDKITELGYTVRDFYSADITGNFVVIGRDYGSQEPLKLQYAGEVIQNIDIYSDYRGTKQIKEIMDNIINNYYFISLPSPLSIYFSEVMYSSITPFITERDFYRGLLQIRFKIVGGFIYGD